MRRTASRLIPAGCGLWNGPVRGSLGFLVGSTASCRGFPILPAGFFNRASVRTPATTTGLCTQYARPMQGRTGSANALPFGGAINARFGAMKHFHDPCNLTGVTQLRYYKHSCDFQLAGRYECSHPVPGSWNQTTSL